MKLRLVGVLIKADTLDDALGNVLGHLLRSGNRILPSKGPAREFTGVPVELSDSRARFSRTEGRGVLIGFLGEVLWYLSGSDRLDHIEHYIKDYRKFIKTSWPWETSMSVDSLKMIKRTMYGRAGFPPLRARVLNAE